LSSLVRRPFSWSRVLLLGGALLSGQIGCGEPKLYTVTPEDGLITSSASVTVSGTYRNVDEANATVTVNGSPATLLPEKGFRFEATGLQPGANPLLVELRDASKPGARARVRLVVVRGEALAPEEFAAQSIALRLNESFFDALPMSEIVADLLADFVADNPDFQSGFRGDLVQGLIDSADSFSVQISDEDGIRLTLAPDIHAEGQHTFELPGPIPGSVTCAVSVHIGGEIGVQGNLEPDSTNDATLAFDGTPYTAFEVDGDVYDPGGPGLCDAVGVDAPTLLIAPLLNFIGDVVLVGLVDAAAHVVELSAEIHQCLGDCPPDTHLDLEFGGRFESVAEEDDGVLADAALHSDPLDTPRVPSLAVAAALPDLGPTSTLTGRAYDIGMALTPTALNQFLAAFTAEGGLDRDVTDAMPDGVKAGRSNFSARLEADVAPFLDGGVVCPTGIAAPRLVLTNARLHLKGSSDPAADPKIFLSIAFDLVAGVRLRPITSHLDGIAIGPQLVLGTACDETTLTATVLVNETGFDDGVVQAFVNAGLRDSVAAAVSEALTPLPLDQLLRLEDANGDPLATLGLQPVEVHHDGPVFQVFANLLVDGEGGNPNAVALEELFFSQSSPGTLIGLEKIGDKLYLAFGNDFQSGTTSIHALDLEAPELGLSLVAGSVFGPSGWMRGLASDGLNLFAIGGSGDFFSDAREIRRITPEGVVSTLFSWPWDNQFASSIHAAAGYVYFHRSWREASPEPPWYDAGGRAIWRIRTDGTSPERWVGEEGDYLPIFADIGRLADGTMIGAQTTWFDGFWPWAEWYRFDQSSGSAGMLGYANDFALEEISDVCGDQVVAVGEAFAGGGEIWSSGTATQSERKLEISFPPLVAGFGGITRYGNTLYVASGSSGSGVQVYELAWECN